MLEPASWPCIGAQVNDGSHVVRHVKERIICMILVVDFGPIHGNTYTLAAALATLVYGQITNTNKNTLLFTIQCVPNYNNNNNNNICLKSNIQTSSVDCAPHVIASI